MSYREPRLYCYAIDRDDGVSLGWIYSVSIESAIFWANDFWGKHIFGFEIVVKSKSRSKLRGDGNKIKRRGFGTSCFS